MNIASIRAVGFKTGLSLIVMLVAGNPVQSATLRVPSQITTLALAIDAAASGDIIELENGIHTGSGFFNLDLSGRSLTIKSASGDVEQCIIDLEAVASRRGFIVESSEVALVISGITIRRASSGAIYANAVNGLLEVENCRFEDNLNSSTVLVNQSGGPLTVSVAGCDFLDNTANDPNACLYIRGLDFGSDSLRVTGCGFYRNTGNALDVLFPGGEVSDCDVEDTTRRGASIGGGVDEDVIQVRNCSFLRNGSVGQAGGVFTLNCIFEECLFAENIGFLGGGVQSQFSEFIMCNFERNVSMHQGGGLYSANRLRVMDCRFIGNTASSGGGIFLNQTAGLNTTIEIVNTTLLTNSASADGGGMALQLTAGNQAARIEGCVIAANVAGGDGGGMWNTGFDLEVSSSTLYENASGSGGGSGIHMESGGLNIDHTIIACGVVGEGIACQNVGVNVSIDCVNIYNNAGGDWAEDCIDEFAPGVVNSTNMSESPMFCNAASADFRVSSSSPVLPNNNSVCTEVIGVGSIGCASGGGGTCATVPVKTVTWGDLKSRYR